MSETSTVMCVCCSVLRREVEHLRQLQGYPMDLVSLDSELHNHPDKLESELNTLIQDVLEKGNSVLLVFGDCHAFMHETSDQDRVYRAGGTNCADLVLGKQKHKQYLHDGSLFLFPEWAMRWDRILKGLFGKHELNEASYIQETFRKLVYLDTGLLEIPEEKLQECSTYFELPVEYYRVSLDVLQERIENGLQKLKDSNIA